MLASALNGAASGLSGVMSQLCTTRPIAAVTVLVDADLHGNGHVSSLTMSKTGQLLLGYVPADIRTLLKVVSEKLTRYLAKNSYYVVPDVKEKIFKSCTIRSTVTLKSATYHYT